MSEEKEKLDHLINFRATEDMYKSLIKYLEHANKTISVFMREITYDYIKFKKVVKENGYGHSEPVKKKKQPEVKINAPPQAIMYCDSDHCERDPRKMEKC